MRTETGFTIIELMVTLTVAGILITLAVPGFTRFIATNRIASQTNAFVTTLNYARSEAVKLSRNVEVCAGNEASGCTGGWSDGWLVFQDKNGDGTADSDEILRVHPGLSGGTQFGETGGSTSFTFDASGAIGGNLTFHLQPSECQSGLARDVTVAPIGQVRTSSATCS